MALKVVGGMISLGPPLEDWGVGVNAAVAANQYSPYRLLHFARICRVEKLAIQITREIGRGRDFKGRQARPLWQMRL